MTDRDNYFERTRRRIHPKEYRFYFFDYLYYKGERWGEKKLGFSGSFLVWWFWWLDVTIPVSVPMSHWWDDSVRYALCAALFVLPFAFTAIRYRKDRRAAVMKHYRRSKSSGLVMFLLLALSFAVLFVELWALEEMGLARWGKCFM